MRADTLTERGVVESEERRSIWVRLGWMAAIWAMSVAALGMVAWALRWWLAA